jgi:very-short-patch-repair endonuclease
MKTIPFENSFASHPKAKFWSTERNNGLKPEDFALNSHKKYWFDCECGHPFESSLLNINQNNNWCGYCSNPPKKLCIDENCEMCFNNSFASHSKSIYWSDENELRPREVFKNTDRKKFKFDCECGHKLDVILKGISRDNKWCKYCAHQSLCENDECQMCWNNSFASIEKCKLLSDKTINPRTLFKSSRKKLKFNCDICNNPFYCNLADITKGVWCSFCVNKTEKLLYNKLVEKYDNLKSQYKVEWCKNKKCLPFDFVIEDIKIIIELDGKQHFEQIGNWPSPENNRQIDCYKMKCANKNGFSIIRILQKDVYNNKYDWLTELCDNIEKLSNDNRVQNIYMCKNNEYKDFEISI